jgi:hypothetical protein
VFDIITRFSETNYPNDVVLKQLIAVDYYLHFKVKPQQLFLNEVEHTEKFKLIDQRKLNHHKYRYVILTLDFNYTVFASENKIKQESHNVFIQYTGTSKAEVV